MTNTKPRAFFQKNFKAFSGANAHMNGNRVVLLNGAIIPQPCVIKNDNDEGRKKRRDLAFAMSIIGMLSPDPLEIVPPCGKRGGNLRF